MLSLYLLGRSSTSDCRGGGGGGGGLVPLPLRKMASFVGIGAHAYGAGRNPRGGAGPFAAAAAGGEQDHYFVLGLSKNASPGEIKKAYRLLARKVKSFLCQFDGYLNVRYSLLLNFTRSGNLIGGSDPFTMQDVHDLNHLLNKLVG